MPHFYLIRKYQVLETCIVEALTKEDAKYAAEQDDNNVVIINDNSTDIEVYYPDIQEANQADIEKYKAVKSRRARWQNGR